MKKLSFQVDIHAPVHVVWSAMLDDATYRRWTGASFPGSFYEGSWDLGDTIRFVGPSGENDPALGGLVAKVVANRPDEFVSVEYLGLVIDGEDDTTSADAAAFAGTHESYSFSETGGVTTVRVELDTGDEYAAMLSETWPGALDALKEIAQSSASGATPGTTSGGA